MLKDIKIPYTLDDVYNNANHELFTVISTFAGAGGSSTGYKLAGGKILAINEFADNAIDCYLENYPNTPVLSGDIKTLTGQGFLDIANIKKYELDILDGSPPCSAFSISGNREKGWNKTKKYSEDKKIENIEDLFLEYIRICNDIQPKTFVAENVEGITIGVAKNKLNKFINKFKDIGYYVHYKVLNAANFGTPQNRKRCFIIGVRKDVINDLKINPMILPKVLFPKEYDTNRTTLKDVNFSEILSPEEEIKMLEDYFKYKSKMYQYWCPILEKNPLKPISPSDTKFIDINPKGSYFNMIRSSEFHPSPTLTQKGQQLAFSGVIHYAHDRKFTINESKIIMGCLLIITSFLNTLITNIKILINVLNEFVEWLLLYV